jgi:hypothetical protein
MLANFAHLIATCGFVPNSSRSYMLSRSQPPFFFRMVELLHADDPAAGFAAHLPSLQAEHAFWMDGEATLAPGQAHRRVVRTADGALLNRYWDDRCTPREESWREDVETAEASRRPREQVWRDLRAGAESGWDFSGRWCADPADIATIETTALAPVDLNALLAGLEGAMGGGRGAAPRRRHRPRLRGPCRHATRAAADPLLARGRRPLRGPQLARRQRPAPADRRRPGAPVPGPGDAQPGGCDGGAGPAPSARRQRPADDGAGDRPAVGRPQRLGAAAVDGRARPGALRPRHAGA